MADFQVRYFDKNVCSGMVFWGKRRALFYCRTDGRVMIEPALRVPVPADVREDIERHCNANCRAPRWRRPRLQLKGCGCGR